MPRWKKSHHHRKETQPVGASSRAAPFSKTLTAHSRRQARGSTRLQGQGPRPRPRGLAEAHGNFILNSGGAKARDVLDLIADIRQSAMNQRGITLETEVQIIGEEQAIPL